MKSSNWNVKKLCFGSGVIKKPKIENDTWKTFACSESSVSHFFYLLVGTLQNSYFHGTIPWSFLETCIIAVSGWERGKREVRSKWEWGREGNACNNLRSRRSKGKERGKRKVRNLLRCRALEFPLPLRMPATQDSIQLLLSWENGQIIFPLKP